MSEKSENIKILGINISTKTKIEILEEITTSLEKRDKKLFITTPNPEIIVRAHHKARFKTLLNTADIALPDGVGLVIAARLLGKPLKGRITGVDLMENLCEILSKRHESIGLLGGKKGVAISAAACLGEKYPGLKISYASDAWDEAKTTGKIDVLFVAFGAPKQEEWISTHLAKVPITAAMGVGGAFDYVSGEVTRAPEFVRTLGFEWLFRLLAQPWRIKRQIALVEFTYLVFKEYFKKG